MLNIMTLPRLHSGRLVLLSQSSLPPHLQKDLITGEFFALSCSERGFARLRHLSVPPGCVSLAETGVGSPESDCDSISGRHMPGFAFDPFVGGISAFQP